MLEASLYPFSDNFVCLDGSATISFENINDNYCDCPNGSDEPGLSHRNICQFVCHYINSYCVHWRSTKFRSQLRRRMQKTRCDFCFNNMQYSQSWFHPYLRVILVLSDRNWIHLLAAFLPFIARLSSVTLNSLNTHRVSRTYADVWLMSLRFAGIIVRNRQPRNTCLLCKHVWQVSGCLAQLDNCTCTLIGAAVSLNGDSAEKLPFISYDIHLFRFDHSWQWC